MKFTLLMEYDSEAQARGHAPHYYRLGGEAKWPRNVKTACNIIDGWKIPYSAVEIREGDSDGETIGMGNFDDLLLEVEEKLLKKWEDGLGVKFTPL